MHLPALLDRPRFDPTRRIGHYESWFCRANHPRDPHAFWIRYTVFAPAGRPEGAEGELWAVSFEDDRIVHGYARFPYASCGFGEGEAIARIGPGTLTASTVEGSFEADQMRAGDPPLRFSLRYATDHPGFHVVPWLLRQVPRTAKVCVPRPLATFTGTLHLGSRAIAIDSWLGSQNHNWGPKHTELYWWGQVAGFDDAPHVFLECFSARHPRFGWITRVLVSEHGRLLGGTGSDRFNVSAVRDGMRLAFTLRSRAARFTVEIEADPRRVIDLPYRDPPGGERICSNSKTARATLVIEPWGQPARRYEARHRAALEVVDPHRYGQDGRVLPLG